MKWQSIKIIPILPGVITEVTEIDGTIQRVEFRTDDGKPVLAFSAPYSNITVSVPVPPKFSEKFTVRSKYGLIVGPFNCREAAEEAAQNLNLLEFDIEIQQVELPE